MIGGTIQHISPRRNIFLKPPPALEKKNEFSRKKGEQVLTGFAAQVLHKISKLKESTTAAKD